MAKIELFDRHLQSTATIFKALSHPARLAILQLIARAGTCLSTEISSALPLGRTTINQHLKELRDLGLIRGEAEGVRVKYRINKFNVDDANENVTLFIRSLRDN